jgi:hypothetical protein
MFFTHCLGRMARTAAGSRCGLVAISVDVDIQRPRVSSLATTVDHVRAPEPRRWLGAILVVILLAVGGCGGDDSGPVVPSLSPAPTPSDASPAPTLPADGVSLQRLGYLNGPVQQFSLPRTSVIIAAVDQPNNVTAVLSSPSATEVAGYLRRTLPMTGFSIVEDDPAAVSMTFAGYGWTGSFTGKENTSAVLLRPQ